MPVRPAPRRPESAAWWLGGVLGALGCHPASTVADSAPSDSASPAACSAVVDPSAPMDFLSLIGRLSDQRCLQTADQNALAVQMQLFHAQQTVWCDAVYRLSSPDGLWFEGTPELVHEHASVPDVAITATGEQIVVYNDLDPDLLIDTLRTDPARFWRQGLLGLGGLGMAVNDGTGFVDASFDAHFDALSEVVDPDLYALPNGDLRFAWYAVPAGRLPAGTWDPYMADKPHAFFRSESSDSADFPSAGTIVQSSDGDQGDADPTMLSLPDGGEVLYASSWDQTAKGWTSPDAVAWDVNSPPAVDTLLEAAGPDTLPDGAGGYRMYYVDSVALVESMATSSDGLTWTAYGQVMQLPGASGGSVARAPDGTWWIYFNIPDATCVQSASSGG